MSKKVSFISQVSFLSFVLLLLALPLRGQSSFTFEQGGYQYLITSVQGGELTVTGISEGCSPGLEVVFPETISYNNRSFQVTALADSLFMGTDITSVTLPSGLKSIGSYAFYDCSRLKKLEFPLPLREVGAWAFGKCTGLTHVTLNPFLAGIEEGTFYGCTALRRVEPATMTDISSIGDRAFENCHALTSFKSGKYSTNIGKYAFKDCWNLTNPDFYWDDLYGQKVHIQDSAFYNASSLSSLPNIDKVYTMVVRQSAFENAGLKGTLSLSLHRDIQ